MIKRQRERKKNKSGKNAWKNRHFPWRSLSQNVLPNAISKCLYYLFFLYNTTHTIVYLPVISKQSYFAIFSSFFRLLFQTLTEFSFSLSLILDEEKNMKKTHNKVAKLRFPNATNIYFPVDDETKIIQLKTLH